MNIIQNTRVIRKKKDIYIIEVQLYILWFIPMWFKYKEINNDKLFDGCEPEIVIFETKEQADKKCVKLLKEYYCYTWTPMIVFICTLIAIYILFKLYY